MTWWHESITRPQKAIPITLMSTLPWDRSTSKPGILTEPLMPIPWPCAIARLKSWHGSALRNVCWHRASQKRLSCCLSRPCRQYGRRRKAPLIPVCGQHVHAKMGKSTRLPKWKSLCCWPKPMGERANRSRCRRFCAG